MAIVDSDQRSIALKYCDSNELFKGTKAKMVGESSKKGNELWCIPAESKIFQQDEYFLRMWCPSTKAEYIEGVSPDWIKETGKDADALQARSLEFSKEEYLDSAFVET